MHISNSSYTWSKNPTSFAILGKNFKQHGWNPSAVFVSWQERECCQKPAKQIRQSSRFACAIRICQFSFSCYKLLQVEYLGPLKHCEDTDVDRCQHREQGESKPTLWTCPRGCTSLRNALPQVESEVLASSRLQNKRLASGQCNPHVDLHRKAGQAGRQFEKGKGNASVGCSHVQRSRYRF